MKKLLLIILVFCSYAASAQVAKDTVSTTVSDADGTVISVKFEGLSGPIGAVIETPNPPVNAVKTVISFPAAGVYVFQLSATDNDGTTSKIQFKETIVQNLPPKIEIISDSFIKIK